MSEEKDGETPAEETEATAEAEASEGEETAEAAATEEAASAEAAEPSDDDGAEASSDDGEADAETATGEPDAAQAPEPEATAEAEASEGEETAEAAATEEAASAEAAEPSDDDGAEASSDDGEADAETATGEPDAAQAPEPEAPTESEPATPTEDDGEQIGTAEVGGGVYFSGPVHTNEEAISVVFTGTGAESEPGDPHKSHMWDDQLDGPLENATSPKVLAFTVIAVAVLLGGGYAALPADLKTDAVDLLQGQDIIEARELREQARIEAERRAMLEAAPKFGTVEIVTSPNNLLITSEGQDAMVFPGTRTDLTYPTRSRVTYQDISVTEDFVFTIHGEGNFQDLTYTIPSFGQPDTPWVQSFTGDYHASLTFMACWPGEAERVESAFCLRPAQDVDWRARELQWRAAWRPDPAETDPEAIVRLPGSITVTSEPTGALIAFNGRQLVNEETGEPFRTPHTFTTYNAPPDNEDRTPLEVYLSREGLPLQLLYDGKASMTMGIYSHQFNCALAEGQTAPAALPADAPPETEAPSWLGVCAYSYSVHAELSDPKPPEEGSGEGSGSGAAAAPAAPVAPAAGSGSAAPE